MIFIGFGMVLKKSEYPFHTFSASALASLDCEDSWVIVLKESVRSFEATGLQSVGVSTMNAQHNTYLEEFSNYVVKDEVGRRLTIRPDWILFPGLS
jgi:hypothetical protein